MIWGEGIWLWPYMRMDTTTRLDLPDAGDVEGNQPFTVALWLRPDLRPLESKDDKQPSGVILARADAKNSSRGWQLRINQRKLAFTLAHEAPHNAATVETKEKRADRGTLEPYCCDLLTVQAKPTAEALRGRTYAGRQSSQR